MSERKEEKAKREKGHYQIRKQEGRETHLSSGPAKIFLKAHLSSGAATTGFARIKPDYGTGSP